MCMTRSMYRGLYMCRYVRKAEIWYKVQLIRISLYICIGIRISIRRTVHMHVHRAEV